MGEFKRIIGKFSTVQEWLSTPQGNMPCRAKCGVCEIRWRRTGSAFVNMAISAKTGKAVYICDKCVKEIEAQIEENKE